MRYPDLKQTENRSGAPALSGIRRVPAGGIAWLQPLRGSGCWTWGTDYTSGDLYEAEELYGDGHRIRRNRLIFVHCPDGRVAEPVKAKDGQYFGSPAFDGGCPVILLADFPAGELCILRYDDARGEVTPIVTLPRSAVEDCYNLMLHRAPLMLTRQTSERFQVIWPEKADFPIHGAESFVFREGDRLYFSRWYEDPDYREEVVVRRFPTGEIIGRFHGSLNEMPDGQHWLLTEGNPPLSGDTQGGDLMEQLERIGRMEEKLDRSAAAIRALEQALEDYEAVAGDIRDLDAYLAGEDWRADFAADENGLLPPELKKGVLSEDGIYDLLEAERELRLRMQDPGNRDIRPV
jgi:hypothetical protein